MENNSVLREKFIDIIKQVDISIVMKNGKTMKQIAHENSISIKNVEKKTGLTYLRETIESILKDYTKTFFFEYTILSSTLDSNGENCLISMACVSDNSSENYGESIIGKVGEVLSSFTKDNTTNWFHNPELFIAPTQCNITHSFSKNLDCIKTTKISTFSNNNKRFFSQTEKNISIANFSYNRPFEEIIKSAIEIAKRTDPLQENINGHMRMHKMYDETFYNRHLNTCYISLPILGTSSTNWPAIYDDLIKEGSQKLQGQGTFFLYFLIEEEKENDVYGKIEEIKSRLFSEIGDLIRIYSYNYIFNNGLNLLMKAQNEAIKAAKAAIMSRNMSHNLGSHVMYYLNLKLSSVGHIFKENVLKDLISSTHNRDNSITISLDTGESIGIEHKLDSITEISLPFLMGLGRFINYLQERMDFIATISTDYIPYFLTVSFKDGIYDEFNYDLRVRRHRDVISEFKNKQVENIILDYIARSEGLARNDISIQFRSTNKNGEISIFDGEETPTLNNSKTGNAYAAYKALNDIQVDLPGGQTGRQAFFSMLENIIRNAAKHGLKQTNNNKKLTVTISLEDSKEYPDLYKCTIVDSFKSVLETANKINEIIRNGYIKPNGEMDENGKGIKEILISATWLRGIDNLRQENLQNILKADLTKNEHLRYTFYLLKPQKCALIISENLYQKECNFSLKESQKYGWNIYDESITENEFSNLRHKIIVIDNSLGEEKNNMLKKLSSSRILVYDIERIKTLILSVKKAIFSNNIKDDLEKLYQQQYGNWLKDMKFDLKSILIYDNKLNPIPENNFEIIEVLKPNRCPSKNKPFILINSAINSTEELKKYTGLDIVFKSHFVKADYDKSFFKDNFNYIESITGHNSTDRLIRHTKIDDLLFYQLNESAQTKVLLIDERFWSDYTGIDNDSIETFLNDCFTSDDNMSPKDIMDEVQHMIDSGRNLQIKDDVIEYFDLQDLPWEKQDEIYVKIEEYAFEKPLDFESAKELSKIIPPKRNATNHILKSLPQIDFLRLRGIYIYNIIETKEASIIIPMDFDSRSFLNGEIICYKVNVQNGISIIPCVYNNNKRNLTKIKNSQEYNFHIMSIHQGILDKIYKRLNKQTDINKVNVTNVIKKFFIKEKHINKPLIIHSGRSKPTQKDMPQEVPFIQFSSLKNALNDCKFTLTELLYGAKYKK